MARIINSVLVAFGMVGVPLIASMGLGPWRISSPNAWTKLLAATFTISLVINLIGSLLARKAKVKRNFRNWAFVWLLSGLAALILVSNPSIFSSIQKFLRSLKLG